MGRRAPRDEDEDADPTMIAFQTQQCIVQLRRERDESIRAAVAESHALMEDLKTRITAHVRDQQTQRARRQAQHVAQIMALVEHRKDLEQRMGEVAGRMRALMSELGELVAVACEGRLRDARCARTEDIS